MTRKVLSVSNGIYIFTKSGFGSVPDVSSLRVGFSYAGMPRSDVFSLAVRELHSNYGRMVSFSNNYFYPIDTRNIEFFGRRFSVESVNKKTLTLIVEDPSEDWMI